MTTEEARYYRASRGAFAAWQATQPQLALSGLDDGPLTADGSRDIVASSSGKADGGHHRTLGWVPCHTTGADGSPKGNNVRPQNGD